MLPTRRRSPRLRRQTPMPITIISALPPQPQSPQYSRKKQILNRQRQRHMRQRHAHHNHATRPPLDHADHGPQVPGQEAHTHGRADGDKHPVQRRDRRPADERDGDPDDVRVAVQRPALHQADPALARTGAVPAQQAPHHDGHDERVAIDEAGGAAEELEVVGEVLGGAGGGEILADGAGEEEDEDDGGGEPEGAVEVGVGVEGVEEGGARVEGGEAAVEDGGGVDVEELGVEAEGPEVAFGGGGGGGGGGWGEGGGFVAEVGRVGEVWGC